MAEKDWNGLKERRNEEDEHGDDIVCRRNCLDHPSTQSKIQEISDSIAVFADDRETNQKFYERVNMLVWILGLSFVLLISGMIYVFTTNAKFRIHYAQDSIKFFQTIEEKQNEIKEFISGKFDKLDDRTRTIEQKSTNLETRMKFIEKELEQNNIIDDRYNENLDGM